LSDVDAVLDHVELTESGGGLEYFTVTNKSNRGADLSGFLLNVMDPETGGIHAASKGMQISEGEGWLLRRRPQSGVAHRSWTRTGRRRSAPLSTGSRSWLSLKTRCHFSIMGGAIVDTIFV
jgi:hypothetical protein